MKGEFQYTFFMLFEQLKAEDDKHRIIVENFLLQHEEKCVSLLEHFFRRDTDIYYFADAVNGQLSIVGVISYSKGGQLIHCLNLQKLTVNKNEVQKMFKKKSCQEIFSKIFSLIGTKEEGEFLSGLLKLNIEKEAKHFQEYDLLELADSKIFQNFACSADAKCPGVSELEALFPLQKAYEQEEVYFDLTDWKEAASRLVFKKKLEKHLVHVLVKNGEPCTKLTVSSKGKKCVQIGGMYTLPECRNKGFAKELILSTGKKYYDCGWKLVLFVKKTNEPAKKLYQNCGFRKVSDYKIFYY